MVRAILDGRKTQTRRICKTQPKAVYGFGVAQHLPDAFSAHIRVSGGVDIWLTCPYGKPGDRLWVRETWARYNIDKDGHEIAYRATIPNNWPNDGRWRPSIHMPRWASRIDLEITKIRIERLKEISDSDCKAEGYPVDRSGSDIDAWLWYRNVWESINGTDSFKLNPWVWVIEFKRIDGGAHVD